MIRLCQTLLCVAVGAVLSLARADNLPAAPVMLVPQTVPLMPPVPRAASPVTFFRELLAMSPVERVSFLTNRPPVVRERILAKVNEYLALDPDERELRLCATELRWYLLPLLRTSPTNYEAQLARVPDDLRPLVKSRLQQRQILPPPLQQEFLNNDSALHYFTHVEPTNSIASEDVAGTTRQKIADQFNQFFELTPAEKEKTLDSLSDAERSQMEKTLQSFDQLPLAQRSECMRNFTRFAEMSPQERAEFLQNARLWAKMSPKERQAWRDLVAHVPLWPPLPPSVLAPPLPPLPKVSSPPAVATNNS
jgi:hypothetical protein